MTPAICEAPKRTDRRREIATVLETRRRAIRVDIGARLIATAAAPQTDVAVMDITSTGFRVATTEPVPVNAVFVADLTQDDGTRVSARARVAYCRPQRPDGHDGGYVSRLDFVGDPDAA